MKLILKGNPATNETGQGRLILNSQEAKENTILIKHHTVTDDYLAIMKCSGLITQVGGNASHASIVAREFNKPCIVNCDLQIQKDGIKVKDTFYPVGTELIINGITGGVYLK